MSKTKWETVCDASVEGFADLLERIPVPGGHIYRSTQRFTLSPEGLSYGDDDDVYRAIMSESSVFVPEVVAGP